MTTTPRRSSRTSRTGVASNAPPKSAVPSGRTAKRTGSKKAQKPATKAAQKSTSSNLPSASSLLNNSQQTTDDWYKSPRTKKGYANYVKSGKSWLVDWTAEDRLDDEISFDAFDVITAETPLALRALTAYKCEHLERGFASAEGLRSAFKDYFERVCGCQGEFWRYNDHTKKWEGNPVHESNFKAYYESLKNCHNRTGTATQALPMLPSDLKIIMAYLDSEEAITYFTLTQRLYFKAFVTTAFTLWTRNDELINLQFKDIKFDQRSKTGIPYHEFSLIFRKTNKDPTKVQIYKVQADLAHPEIDCYTHTSTWKLHMEGLLGRPLSGGDYVFPAIASTGKLKFGECTSRSAFETLLETVVEKSNVMQGRNGKFTTHCFRRGGAQYRFLWAERKWSLKAVKWWGGWSSNENVGTLMRYLLDELMAYEEGFSDIMMDDRVVDRHETFMGEDESAPLCKADLVRLEGTLLAKLQGLIEKSSSSAGVLPVPSLSTQTHSRTRSKTPPAVPPRQPSPTPEPIQYTPQPTRIPETNTLDDALQYWEHGCPQKGLTVALKHWSQQFKSSDYAKEAVKLGNIRFVCEELITHYGRDFVAFEAKYPGLRRKFTMLMKAVRAERKIRGDTKSRNRRK
ncbi:hypothetical protein B0H16DRAFT_1725751 [Mycena metata]|uniref:Tyr recombinase domain-containing protein n=1 Tax=Mycena metata TaxID=1033252 RepID=A0AAD7IQ43_9AGAR|nr:hypothetical protein B0H16DRAFT_1725751 [Mycena metata]